MKLRIASISLLVLVLSSAGCGSDDSSSTTLAEDPTVSDSGDNDVEDDDGNQGDAGDADAGGALPSSVPDDFPIALPSDWAVDVNAEIGLSSSAAMLLYAGDRYDDIVAFYDEWTQSQPDEYARTEAGDQIIYTRQATPPYLITITRNHEDRGETWTLLQASGTAN